MPRIRSIKPAFFSDERMAELPRDVRLTFLGLISHADDEGRLKGDVRLIKAQIWPLDDDIDLSTIESHLGMLADGAAGRIQRYEVNGRRYIQVRNFARHQYIQKKKASELPAPPPVSSPYNTDPVRLREQYRGEGIQEGIQEAERSGTRARDLAAGAIPEDPDPFGVEAAASAAAPRVELPATADRLVEQLYGLSTEKRRLDVRRQLYETVAAQGRGARIRRGVFVKARSPAHLEQVCRDVLDDPPREIDAAIVVVLRKLQDPPPGPTASEMAATAESQARKLEDAYLAEQRAAGLAWAKTHDEEFKHLRRPIDIEFGDPTNTFARMARDAALAQSAARAAGFPSFDAWRAGQHTTAGAA